MQYRQEINSPGIFLSKKTPGVSLFCNKVYLGWLYRVLLGPTRPHIAAAFRGPSRPGGFSGRASPLDPFLGGRRASKLFGRMRHIGSRRDGISRQQRQCQTKGQNRQPDAHGFGLLDEQMAFSYARTIPAGTTGPRGGPPPPAAAPLLLKHCCLLFGSSTG